MKKSLGIIPALILAFTACLYGQPVFEITTSKVTIAGTSTLHDWESSVNTVNASGEILLQGTELKSIPRLRVEIPVESIKSTKGSIMDKKTWGAFNSKVNPKIVYQLTRINAITRTGDHFTVNATGNLSMAGTTKSIDLTVKAYVGNDGSVRFEGSKALKMTDFKMEQPTALMGTIKTGDEVTVSFNVGMSKAKS